MEWVEDLEKLFVQCIVEDAIAWDEIDAILYEEVWDSVQHTDEEEL